MVVEIFQRRGLGGDFIYKVQEGRGLFADNTTAGTRKAAEKAARRMADKGERIVLSKFEGGVEVIREGS